MRYHIVYLVAGERRCVQLDAADAAGALAGLPDRSQTRFELLAIMRSDRASSGQRSAAVPDAPTRGTAAA